MDEDISTGYIVSQDNRDVDNNALKITSIWIKTLDIPSLKTLLDILYLEVTGIYIVKMDTYFVKITGM